MLVLRTGKVSMLPMIGVLRKKPIAIGKKSPKRFRKPKASTQIPGRTHEHDEFTSTAPVDSIHRSCYFFRRDAGGSPIIAHPRSTSAIPPRKHAVPFAFLF